MNNHLHVIKNGALFITDAHDGDDRADFWDFLCALRDGNITCSQLFILGDMFDFVAGEIALVTHKYAKYIEIINELSQKIPVYYFEGNHDYNLDSVFPYANVYKLHMQPVRFTCNEAVLHVAHGDYGGSTGYKIYRAVFSNRVVLRILNFIDIQINNYITKTILRSQNGKTLCNKIENFEAIIKNKTKLKNFEKNSIIVEGHYHQGRKFAIDDKTYYNLDAFACNQRYFIVRSDNDFEIISNELKKGFYDRETRKTQSWLQ